MFDSELFYVGIYNNVMMIIKNGLKNFFINLKYFFIPLGTLFLGIIIGFSIVLPLLNVTLTTFVENISSLSLIIDGNAFVDSLWRSLSKLDWSNTFDALGILFSREYLETTITDSLKSLLVNYDQYVVQIEGFVSIVINEITVYLGVIIVCLGIGFIGGFFLIKILVRKEIADRKFYQLIIVTIADTILSGGLMTLCIYLFSLWKFSALVSTLLSYIIYALIALYEAYIVHGYKKIDVKKVVTIKNSSHLILSDIAIIVVAWIFSSLSTMVFNELAGIVIGITFMEVAFVVIGMNAESYVKELVENPNLIDSKPTIKEKINKVQEEKTQKSKPKPKIKTVVTKVKSNSKK